MEGEPTCPGDCCDHATIGARFIDALTSPEPCVEPGEAATILDMIVVREMYDDGEVLFSCKRFDAAKRLCTRYDERPRMCSAFPYPDGPGCVWCTLGTLDGPARRWAAVADTGIWPVDA